MLTDGPRSIIERRRLVTFKPAFLDREHLKQEYVVKGKSAKQIGRDMGCSHSTVLSHLRAAGIDVRASTLNHQKGQLAFGRKISKGIEIKHKCEQEAAAKMASLRKQGFSYHKIADILNTMKIPTKTRKARWHGTTVMKILNARTSEGP